MAEMMRLMPARCSRCGAVFDLHYDLEGLDQERLMEVLLAVRMRGQRMLCWSCRD